MNSKLNKARPRIELSMTRFYAGIVIGLIFSLVLFLFLSHLYGTFTLMSSSMARSIYDLPEYVFNFYNYFFAAIAVSIGFGETLRYWFHAPRKIWTFRRNRKNAIFSDQRFLQYSFLMLLTKAGVLIFSLLDGTSSFVMLHETYKFFFILIPLILFISSWHTLLRVYRKQAQKWMFISFLICSVFAIGMAQINNGLNEKLVLVSYEFNPVAKLNIDLPKTHAWNKFYRRSLLIEGYNLKMDGNGILNYYLGSTQLSLDTLKDYLPNDLTAINEIEQHLAVCFISADKTIPMREIDAFKTMLREMGYKRIAYKSKLNSVVEKFTVHPVLIIESTSTLSSEELNSIENWEGHITRIASVNKGEIEIDGTLQPIENIESLLTDIKSIYPEGWLVFEYRSTTDLADYVKVISAHKKVFGLYRESKAKSMYGEAYENLEREQKSELRKYSPFYFTTSRLD